MMEKLQLGGIFYNDQALHLGSDKVQGINSAIDLVCLQPLGNRKKYCAGSQGPEWGLFLPQEDLLNGIRLSLNPCFLNRVLSLSLGHVMAHP